MKGLLAQLVQLHHASSLRQGILDCLDIAGEARYEAENSVVHSSANRNRSGNTGIGKFCKRCDDVFANALGVLFFEHFGLTGPRHPASHQANQKEEEVLLRDDTGTDVCES